ncbi:MAG TPA: sigma-70 family RNA polymerase sigma factor [Candidatus Limnocylindria bacterium]|nr:sigma-70 family RNA polymerase sigma factor [Candidatus Limnocylindria bacterium]
MNLDAPDNTLLAAYATDESEAAFRAIADRHVDLVFATAWRLVGDRGMAEEISQNVFLALARKAPRLTGHKTLAGWLHRTAVLESSAKIRAELRRRRRETTAAEISLRDREGSSPLAAVMPLLDEGLMELREGDRVALILRFFEERSLKEVGVSLGVDEDAARKRVSRALQKLAEFFRQRGFALPAATGAAAVLTEGTQAAPTGLAAAVTKAGLAAGPAMGGSLASLLRYMSLGQPQVAALCLLMAVGPLVWQWRSARNAQQARTSLAAELADLQARRDALALERSALDANLQRASTAAIKAHMRFETAESIRSGRTEPPKYRWDDASPYVRVAKKDLVAMDIASVDRTGRLSPLMLQALQLTLQESGRVQTTLNQFLAGYRAAEAAASRPVAATPDDLLNQNAAETRVFEVSDLRERIIDLRADLFARLRALLAPGQFELLREGLRSWMPIDDEDRPLNSGMAIFATPHRVILQAPSTPGGSLGWSVRVPGLGMFTTQIKPGDVPTTFRSSVGDWIAMAQKATPVDQP